MGDYTRSTPTEKNGFLFFWKGYLSQWYSSPFFVSGVNYPTAEHWMMAEKARLFEDKETLKKILEAGHPREAKDLGRTVSNFDQDVWNVKCFDIVVQGNLHKFSQNTDLRMFLLSTRDLILVEASPQDKVWGIGLAQDDPKAWVPSLWEGKNLLGLALMQVRHTLRREREKRQ